MCIRDRYGLEVCRHLIDEPEFIETAVEIRKSVLGHNPEQLLSKKRSRYNHKVFVDQCQICGIRPEGGLDVHHIKFQCTADECGYIDHIHKNIKGNLVVLCKSHHQQVHQKKITINGWRVSLQNGLVLDYNLRSK